ncbi:MAG TPA: ATP-binding protein [Aliidongia sp.]|uniref:ATP-binding protein n=1 Tax=Aliidongia sp. TaxID=1914230 RepID=UPI002DDD9685|nr:ATP-binding protein [Aliidongia sp.]HEV2673436.1 ATP-binding protein [Aliidongia sp.]
MSLLTRLFLLVVLAVLPAIGIQAYNEYDLRASERTEIHRHALTLTRFAAAESDRIIDGVRNLLVALANDNSIVGGDAAACKVSLGRLVTQYPELSTLAIFDPSGHPVCADRSLPDTLSIADKPYFQTALRSGTFAVGGYDTTYGPRPVLPLALAYDGAPGRRGGVLVATLSLDWLNDYFAAKGLDPETAICMIDRNGIYLARLPRRASIGSRAAAPLLAILQAEHETTSEWVNHDDHVDRILGIAPLKSAPNGLWLSVGLPKSAAFASLDRAGERAGLLVALDIGLALLAAWLIGRIIIGRPIGSLLAAAQRWSRGEYRVRVDLSDRTSDFGRLGMAFNDLVEAIDRREREQYDAEVAVRRSEERYRSLISATTAIVWTTDAQGRFTEPQPSWQAFTAQAWPAHEGLRWAEMVHPEDRATLVADFRGSVARGAVFETVGRLWHAPSASWRDFAARAVPVRAPDGHIREWIGAATDVTERRKAEEALKRLTETLEVRVIERTTELAEANRLLSSEIVERREAEAKLEQVQRIEAIGQLTSGVAHDFNNLLTAILGNLELAQMRLGNHPAARSLETAARAAERGATLVSQLLAFARKQRLEPKPVDINRLVDGLSDLLARTIGPTITIDPRLAADPWAALVDPSQIELVLLNLAINARDAMSAGGTLTIETRNLLHRGGGDADLKPGDYVVLSVADTGSGMTDDVRARAFEPFFTTKEVGKGSGLGLSMVYGVVRQSGGGVEIDSVVGMGTTIRVYLPRAEALPEAAVPDPIMPDENEFAGIRLLLVDDDPAVREVTGMMLREIGCIVTEAGSGSEALLLLEQGIEIDIVAADVAMPGMNGRELVRQIRKRLPDIAVLLITGYADPALADDPDGALVTLRKPFRRADLAQAVEWALESDQGGNVLPFRLPGGA